MIENRSILWFGGSDWWAHHKRNEQFTAEYFARHNKVLFINSIGVGMPNPRKSGVAARIARKLRSMGRRFGRSETGVYIASPVFIPFWSVPFVRRLNKRLLLRQIRSIMKKTGMDDPIVISSIPTANEIIGSLPHSLHVYNLFDHFSAYHEDQLFLSVAENDRALRMSADVVICASKGLFDMVAAQRDNVYWVPHGVHPAFLSYESSIPEPEVIAAFPHPRIVYWGQLEHKLDAWLLAELAKARPEWQFLFFGIKQCSYGELETLPNVHFPGHVPPETLPAIGAHADALVMPWIASEWIKYSAPIKLREYLATGKPVVSMDIIDVQTAFPGAAEIAHTTDEWLDAIERVLRTNTPELEAGRRALVHGYSMDASNALFESAIEPHLQPQSRSATE